jgi:serine protease Do
MNSKLFFKILGLSALTVGLVALPGSSARQESTGTEGHKSFQVEIPQEASAQMANLQERLNNLNVIADGDDNVKVLVNGGGSWLGAGISEVTAEKVKTFKLPGERGVVLGKIVPDSPAAKAGLKVNDVVMEINGQRVEGTEEFRRMIREIPSGRTAQFVVWRDGRSQSISVTLGKSEMRNEGMVVAPAAPGSFSIQIPEIPEMGGIFEGGPWTASRTRLGIDAENLDGEFGNYFGAPDGEGILVRGVFPDTPATKAGLKVGDVITSVDGERIRTVGELRAKMAEKSQAKTMRLGVIRNKAALSLSVDIPAPTEKREFHSSVRTNI